MESYSIENLSFTYPKNNEVSLKNVSLKVKKGEFVILCGKSGCGKTTLLRLLKPTIEPYGKKSGTILCNGKKLCDYTDREQATEIGFVMQNPDNQIVTDKVWHELAFGLESLGFDNQEIRARVSEIASFFGIQTWFHKNVWELSGGQKQLLNLASVMVMQPSILLLDEPTSQLDPIARQEFLNILGKINREIGTTIILAEHCLEDALVGDSRIIVIDDGEILVDDRPRKVAEVLKSLNHPMAEALPIPVKIYQSISEKGRHCEVDKIPNNEIYKDSGERDLENLEMPLAVAEGRNWLTEYCCKSGKTLMKIPNSDSCFAGKEKLIELRNLWFRYERNSEDIIKGLNLEVYKGEVLAVVGGNGTGKSTALNLITGINTAYRGQVLINGEKLSKIKTLYSEVLAFLPQNPQDVFLKGKVSADLLEGILAAGLSKDEKWQQVLEMAEICKIQHLLDRHPYDLSGGEQQRVALAKVLLKNPQILVLDEPTKGMDENFKRIFGNIINKLKLKGVTVIMVSHDIEFCSRYADRCAMFFDGNIVSEDEPRKFFAGKSFYTTATNRMARDKIKNAILEEDVIFACTGKRRGIHSGDDKDKACAFKREEDFENEKCMLNNVTTWTFKNTEVEKGIENCRSVDDASGDEKLLLAGGDKKGWREKLKLIESIVKCDLEINKSDTAGKFFNRRTFVAMLFIMIAIPTTLYIGNVIFDERRYYFTSIFIIIEILIPFFMMYESKKPQAREMVIISVLCAIAVVGRGAFFMLPQFKPVVAMVIIAGICFGGEAGFLVGAVTGFVSNFFFGQGPWTPWQMFAFGMIGFLAGIIFTNFGAKKNKITLAIYGFLATLVIYGGIMNPVAVLMSQSEVNWKMLLSSYIVGLPFDLIHSISTVVFIWIIAESMIEKLERIKVKYGLVYGGK